MSSVGITTPPFRTTVASGARIMERAIRAVRARFKAARTYNALCGLSVSQLRDTGINGQDLSKFSRAIARRSI